MTAIGSGSVGCGVTPIGSGCPELPVVHSVCRVPFSARDASGWSIPAINGWEFAEAMGVVHTVADGAVEEVGAGKAWVLEG